jgi:hypothetical protein
MPVYSLTAAVFEGGQQIASDPILTDEAGDVATSPPASR